MKTIWTIILLTTTNIFMMFAWYGHLKLKTLEIGKGLGIVSLIMISWGLAFFEYCFQVPANKIGYIGNSGPFSLLQLKVLQEVITLVVFTLFSHIIFGQMTLKANYLFSFFV